MARVDPRPDILIIGAGVTGASIAHHLAARGAGRILVLDRARGMAAGSTGRATGGFRAQFSSAANVHLSLRSREKLAELESETGISPQFVARGYLYIARTDSHMRALREALDVQHRSGATETHEVSPREIAAINPAVLTDDVVGGTFGPRDGFMRPTEILRAYTVGARRNGVRFRRGVTVRSLESRGDHIVAVGTNEGRIPVGTVVNATGAWAGQLSPSGSPPLPIVPVRRQVLLARNEGLLAPDAPMTGFVDTGFHLRVRDGELLLLRPGGPWQGASFDTSFDREWIPYLMEEAAARMPCLAGLEPLRRRAYVGLYEMSPDSHALVGLVPGSANLYVAAGSSGHGVMHSPAIGEIMAGLVVNGTTSLPMASALHPGRFLDGLANTPGLLR